MIVDFQIRSLRRNVTAEDVLEIREIRDENDSDRGRAAAERKKALNLIDVRDDVTRFKTLETKRSTRRI